MNEKEIEALRLLIEIGRVIINHTDNTDYTEKEITKAINILEEYLDKE